MASPRPDSETMRQYENILLEAQVLEVRRSKLDAILRVYVMLGFFTAVLSLVYFGFSFLKITLTDDQRAALIAAGTGLSVAIMSATYLVFRHQRISSVREEYDGNRLDYDLIKEWNNFEAMGRQVLEERGIDFNRKSPRSILTTLQSNGLIPNDLVREISIALDIRNKVVHHVESQPQILVQAAGRILAESNEKLERLLPVVDQNHFFGTNVTAVFGNENTTAAPFVKSGSAVAADSPSLSFNFPGQGKRPLKLDDE